MKGITETFLQHSVALSISHLGTSVQLSEEQSGSINQQNAGELMEQLRPRDAEILSPEKQQEEELEEERRGMEEEEKELNENKKQLDKQKK